MTDTPEAMTAIMAGQAALFQGLAGRLRENGLDVYAAEAHAIADAFAALGVLPIEWGTDEARAEMERRCGTLFDAIAESDDDSDDASAPYAN